MSTQARFGWGWIWRSVLLRRRQLVRLFAMTGAIYVLGLVFPIATQKAVDAIATGRGVEAVGALALVTLVAILFEARLSILRQTIVTSLASLVDRRIARRLYAHLLRLDVDGARMQAGEMLTCFQYARKIQSFVLVEVPRLLFEVGSAVASLVLMFRYDALVAAVTLLCVPPLVLLVRSPLKALMAVSLAQYEIAGEQQNALAETVTHLETAKMLGIEGRLMRHWAEVTDRFLAATARAMDMQRGFFATSQVASRLIAMIVVAVSCLQLMRHVISIGDLLALQILANKVTGPLLQSSDLYGRFQEVDVGMQKLAGFLAEPRERAAATPARKALGQGGIRFEHVSFRYRGGAREVLREIDLALPERGVVAVVGRNGSGKSTFIRLLLGLVRPTTGRIVYGGHDLASYDPRRLRSQIGVVEQETVLFSGTLRTVVGGTPDANAEKLNAALAFAGAQAFVEALPDGLETRVVSNGLSFSGGQRQRLSIARAVMRDPRIALLDEPTAFLDPEAAVQLERRLLRWGRERLLVVVSHHLASVRSADRILVFDDGRLVGDGPHDTLVRDNATYAALWDNYARRGAEPAQSDSVYA